MVNNFITFIRKCSAKCFLPGGFVCAARACLSFSCGTLKAIEHMLGERIRRVLGGCCVGVWCSVQSVFVQLPWGECDNNQHFI